MLISSVRIQQLLWQADVRTTPEIQRDGTSGNHFLWFHSHQEECLRSGLQDETGLQMSGAICQFVATFLRMAVHCAEPLAVLLVTEIMSQRNSFDTSSPVSGSVPV